LADELSTIGRAEEIGLATGRDDGSLRPYVTIWVVRAGDQLYVRSARGPAGGWYVPMSMPPTTRSTTGTGPPSWAPSWGKKRARSPSACFPEIERNRSMSTVPNLTLNNGVDIPAIGFGVFQTPPVETRDAVQAALSAGYRHIDTAAAYGNEREVGEAIAKSGIDRAEVFVETKIWISDYGYDQTLHGFDKSARKLGVDRIDLLILHQALPSDFDRTLGAYRALEKLLADGKVRAIGVSNFMVEHLTRLLDKATVVPAVNQIEVHPYFQQREVQSFGAQHGILAQAWSPIGGITFYREGEHTSTLQDPAIGEIAKAHGKSPAQVMLRWHLQQGRSVIPKSTKPARIAENFDVFDFDLTAEELAAIDGLDTGKRGGPEPEAITLETFGRDIPEA
jgi:diketogulonate reductase-like aldo/keto reductase